MRAKLAITSSLLSFLLALAAPSEAMDEYELVSSVREFRANIAGASCETQKRISARAATRLLDKTITEVSGTVSYFSSGRISAPADKGGLSALYLADSNGSCARYYADSSEYREYCRRMGFVLSKHWLYLGQSDKYDTAYVNKSYQSLAFKYILVAKDSGALDNVRIGQKASFSFNLMNLHCGGDQCYVYGILSSKTAESEMLVCARCDTEYAPASGYRYCPKDGEPLRKLE